MATSSSSRTLNASWRSTHAERKVFVFIHGYNTMFAEGLYRFTQVVHNSGSTAVPVLFTWASRGELTEYVYDNNSATTARDDLEHTFRLLFASDADQINILAHSMGNWVTVEALRQIKIAGGLPQVDKLGSLFLAAPDIDIDVFKSQMRRFGKPRKPFYIVLSKDDQALRASKFIAGGERRLGADENTADAPSPGRDRHRPDGRQGHRPANHSKFAQLAEIAPQLTPCWKRAWPRIPTRPLRGSRQQARPLGQWSHCRSRSWARPSKL